MYGMGKNKLANMLGLNFDEASALIGKFNRRAPFVQMLYDRCMKKANEAGVIRTKLGSKCRFNMGKTTEFGIHDHTTWENASAKNGPNNIKKDFT